MRLESLIAELPVLVAAVARRLSIHGLDDAGTATAVAPLREKIALIRDAFLDRHRHPDTSSKHTFVTHYTRLSVVQGILDAAGKDPCNAFLRRYSSSRFNDPTEGTLLLDALRTCATDCFAPDDPRPAYIASFVAPHNRRDEDPSDPIFDNLRYWRYYGDDGAGCSLHVRVPRRRLHRVLYDERCLMQTVADLSSVCRALSGVLDSSLNLPLRHGLRDRLKRPIMELLGILRFLHKAAPYRDENEYRVLYGESDDGDSIRFDVAASDDSVPDIRPYYVDTDLAADKLFVTGAIITIGPSVRHSEDIRAYFEHLLRTADLLGPVVRISEVRYRG